MIRAKQCQRIMQHVYIVRDTICFSVFSSGTTFIDWRMLFPFFPTSFINDILAKTVRTYYTDFGRRGADYEDCVYGPV